MAAVDRVNRGAAALRAILHKLDPPAPRSKPRLPLRQVRDRASGAVGAGDKQRLYRPTNVLSQTLSSHKIAGLKEAIAAQGAQLLYLPPYSPDLDPIEQAFAKFKAVLRNAAERPQEDYRAHPRSLPTGRMQKLL